MKSTVIAAAVMVFAAVAAYAEPDQATQAIFNKLMTATVSNNYDSFVAECDAAMTAAITKSILESVSHQIEPRARQGYDSHYLGELNQRGYQVHLWKLQFKDGGDDMLATLSVKDGKAGGFYLR